MPLCESEVRAGRFRQQMELVKLYPMAAGCSDWRMLGLLGRTESCDQVELEMWIKARCSSRQGCRTANGIGICRRCEVQESLAIRGVKPVNADRQWIEESSAGLSHAVNCPSGKRGLRDGAQRSSSLGTECRCLGPSYECLHPFTAR